MAFTISTYTISTLISSMLLYISLFASLLAFPLRLYAQHNGTPYFQTLYLTGWIVGTVCLFSWLVGIARWYWVLRGLREVRLRREMADDIRPSGLHQGPDGEIDIDEMVGSTLFTFRGNKVLIPGLDPLFRLLTMLKASTSLDGRLDVKSGIQSIQEWFGFIGALWAGIFLMELQKSIDCSTLQDTSNIFHCHWHAPSATVGAIAAHLLVLLSMVNYIAIQLVNHDEIAYAVRQQDKCTGFVCGLLVVVCLLCAGVSGHIRCQFATGRYSYSTVAYSVVGVLLLLAWLGMYLKNSWHVCQLRWHRFFTPAESKSEQTGNKEVPANPMMI